jgi:hypothetical protein
LAGYGIAERVPQVAFCFANREGGGWLSDACVIGLIGLCTAGTFARVLYP